MPKIQWTNLPAELRDHLFERARERQITTEDLYQLKLWRESSPEAPQGRWYKGLWIIQDLRRGQIPKNISSSWSTCYGGRDSLGRALTFNA